MDGCRDWKDCLVCPYDPPLCEIRNGAGRRPNWNRLARGKELVEGGAGIPLIMKDLGVSRTTAFRYQRLFREEGQQVSQAVFSFSGPVLAKFARRKIELNHKSEGR